MKVACVIEAKHTWLLGWLFLLTTALPLAAENASVTREEQGESATEAPAVEEEAPEGDEEEGANEDSAEAAVARPVSADPVQIYGWREWVVVSNGKHSEKMLAKLDTGALTSSIHAEDQELFERDGKKWVRFVVTDPRDDSGERMRMEAPLVRIARIKEPGGKSEARQVVRLAFEIGDRKMRAEFTLNDRHNMLSPVLIGRRALKELGWVDSSRAYLADEKLMR